MKKLFSFAILSVALLISCNSNAQDKGNRPSPPAQVKQVLASGAEISIDYSAPSVKGRTIGKDLEPKDGQVWRTGANDATVFETSKDVTINGNPLPAGKYALFTISGNDEWAIIFNKTWKQWGAYDYKQADDVLRVMAKPEKAATFTEKMAFSTSAEGVVTLLWGDRSVSFTVK